MSPYTKLTTAFSVCCALALAPRAAQSQTNEIVFYAGVEADRDGVILCGLYDDEEIWLTRDVTVGTKVKVGESSTVKCTFEDIEPGVYAIAAIHDEDGDEEMDRIMGIPQEGYTTSRDAHYKGLYPDWEDAYFEYEGGRAKLSASMKY